MGFFSWTCAVSGKSILNEYAIRENRLSESLMDCYLITPDKTYHEKAYEGYGVFDGHDVYDLLGGGDRSEGIDLAFSGRAPFDIKVVLARYYTGQTYDELPASGDCPYQGYFIDFDD